MSKSSASRHMPLREQRHGHHPHHIHALDKASARHLFARGHIDEKTHDRIVGHAERGMRRARKWRSGA